MDTTRDPILVVDDEPDIRDAMKDYLQACLPVQVVTAPSGPAALELLRRQEVSMILSDSRMPGMDGLEFLVRARRMQKVPCFMVTAFPDMELALRALNEASIDQFLVKPVDPEKLVALIKECLNLP